MHDDQLDGIRSDYQKALRAWHVAWMARVEWHHEHFYPLTEREHSLVYEHVLGASAAQRRRRAGLRPLPESEGRAGGGRCAHALQRAFESSLSLFCPFLIRG